MVEMIGSVGGLAKWRKQTADIFGQNSVIVQLDVLACSFQGTAEVTPLVIQLLWSFSCRGLAENNDLCDSRGFHVILTFSLFGQKVATETHVARQKWRKTRNPVTARFKIF